MVGPLFSLNLSICWSLREASSRARRRADHGVAVNRAVDRIKIRLILSEDRGDAAADPPAWTSNIDRVPSRSAPGMVAYEAMIMLLPARASSVVAGVGASARRRRRGPV